jgi:uncharacterized membrane protein
MKIITDNKRLPKPVLMVIATIGWALVLHLSWRVLTDSWDRADFALDALAGQIPELDPFNDRYTAHPYQTLAHTVAGMVFAILGPLQFMSPIRNRFPRVHRISGRVFLPFGIMSGVAALIMGLSFPVWGFGFNQAIITVWSAFMIFAFVNAFRLVRNRKYLLHREWMMRGFATGLAVAVFRAISEEILEPMGYNFDDRWTIVILISLPITLGATELWIRVTRPRKSVGASV